MSTGSWLVRPASADARARVFCFPYSGAGASAFRAWPHTVGDVEICPVQFPGRENRLTEPHYGTYRRLAADLADGLGPALDRPYAFFGHCAGVLPAFEAAVVLSERGLPQPECLYVSGQLPPHDSARDRMLTMTEPELRADLESVVRGRGLEPWPDMIRMGLSVLLRDLDAAREYRRAEPIVVGFPIVVLHWRDDDEVSLDGLQGWRDYAESVEFRVVDGGHHDFMNASADLLHAVTSWR
ncbi:surfactin synthase thioesterase subunit [Actinoplanes campanulatus]|uniref:Surfactin synthase thioesterase subunit n=1 Tax=Actinoplanes campanulatus TaxID=113559 RepID=A0A7W5ARF1_9ACTN|nr:thioesterase domain-containing protein [Actinoplanes campanulatus]MBB3101073.1 surfactin synthase thioesterase subunit [Actinoplanes campanulatus]GGN49492.1 thioesterase [Actinoplanes campanulatus]GID41836.1 thioesterase [Actinoplanes campanulatus]